MNDECQQMGIWEEKEEEKYCGIGKIVVPLHRQKSDDIVKRQKDIRITQVIN